MVAIGGLAANPHAEASDIPTPPRGAMPWEMYLGETPRSRIEFLMILLLLELHSHNLITREKLARKLFPAAKHIFENFQRDRAGRLYRGRRV